MPTRKSIALFISFCILMSQASVLAKDINRHGLIKPATLSTGVFDGNNIQADMENNGMFVSHRVSGHSGLWWPKGEGTHTIYAAGLWFAGKVNGEIRTAVAEYGTEFTPGPWGSDGTAAADRLYKVNITDLSDPESNPDFAAWPVHQGAPWVDEDGDGIYTPLPDGPDHPEFIGDQVIFYVMNDGVRNDHSIFNTEPLGIEVRMSIWGYNSYLDLLNDVMFIKAQIFNKGGNDIEDMYVGVWSDPDLGNAGDDWVGCDVGRSLGFCYNDGSDNAFGGAAPAVGFDLLQVAIPSGIPSDKHYCFDELKSGYTNLPMSSFIKYIGSDDVYTDPNDKVEAYNYMAGMLRDGSPFINSATGEATKFVHPDDPNLNFDKTDNIWVDGDDNPSDDRRMMQSSGPFSFNSGDSAEVVTALIHGQGISSLSSVTSLKRTADIVQSLFNNNFDQADLPPTPVLVVTPASSGIVLEWDDRAESYADGVVHPYTFEGYNIYQHTSADSSSERVRIATFDLINGVRRIWDEVYEPDVGEFIYRPVQFGNDTGLQRYLVVEKDTLRRNASLINDREYYFSVSSYAYNGLMSPATLESASQIIAIRPQTNVYQNSELDLESEIPVTHTGAADAEVSVRVINPYKLTGDEYTLYFDQQHYYRNLDGLWIKTAYPDAVGKLAKTADLTGTTITGAAVVSPSAGTIDLVYSMSYVSPDGAWIDGFELDLPDAYPVNHWGSVSGPYASYGAASGQNEVNGEGTLAAGNIITWGDSARSRFGAVEGDVFVVVNVDAPITFPSVTRYKVFDDAYGTIVDVSGTITIEELGYEYVTIKHWNLKNSAGNVLLEDQTTFADKTGDFVDETGTLRQYNWWDGYVGTKSTPIIDGFQLNVSGSFTTPEQESSITHVSTGSYDWASYKHYWWAATSRAIDAWGYGTIDINLLQQDYELRWTGVYETTPTNVNGDGSLWYHKIQEGTGSIATWVGARNYSAADHPDSDGNPYFQIRIPFEVWNKDTEEQVSCIIYDRIANPMVDADFYAFNPFDRVYFFLWNFEYDESNTYNDPNGIHDAWNHGDQLTWNIISWEAEWETGDVTTIIYDNPIQLGIDEFKFTPSAPTALSFDPDNIKVWPNPYLGRNPEQQGRYDYRIHFINLPEIATIRIYSLAGQLVRSIEHVGSQEAVWDTRNFENAQVASGIYIAVVSSDEGDKVLKLAVAIP